MAREQSNLPESKGDELYELAKSADEEFQQAVVKQFGKGNAGLMRYCNIRHNAETSAARERYQAAVLRTARG